MAPSRQGGGGQSDNWSFSHVSEIWKTCRDSYGTHGWKGIIDCTLVFYKAYNAAILWTWSNRAQQGKGAASSRRLDLHELVELDHGDMDRGGTRD